jgi:hypothetical protein
MSTNVITEVGHGIKTAAVDTAHAVVKVATALPRAAAVLATALKDEPQVKTAVLALIAQGAKIGADGAIDVADKGTNLVEDAATVADCEAFVNYFKQTFIPTVAALYSEVKADLTATA